MLFTTETISNEDIKTLDNFFNEFENIETPANEENNSLVGKYITSLVSSCYAKSVDDIAQIRAAERARLSTEREVRKRNLRTRREKAQNTANATDIMNRWIDYIEVSEEIRKLT